MIKRQRKQGQVQVTFALETDRPVSVVGDFNDWTPMVHPLKKRSNGKWSVTIPLASGRHSFRYLADGGDFFDDPEADEIEDNGMGDTHGVLVVD